MPAAGRSVCTAVIICIKISGCSKLKNPSSKTCSAKKVTGIRQHYLNLNIPETWQIQSEAGFEYDASYGKKRAIGWKKNRYRPFVDETSGIYVIPLVLMECYLFSKAQHDQEKAWKMTKNLMDEAETNNAPLTVLWHQRMFNEEGFPGCAHVYRKLIVEGWNRNAEFIAWMNWEIYSKMDACTSLPIVKVRKSSLVINRN